VFSLALLHSQAHVTAPRFGCLAHPCTMLATI
jgi:hypothetical protein